MVRRDDGTLIRVVAGEVDGVAATGDRDLRRARVPRRHAAAGDALHPAGAAGPLGFAYVFEGEGRFGVGCDLGYRGDLDGVQLSAPQMAVFGDGDEVRVEADDVADPLPARRAASRWDEPIARYGPFVMNTREELQVALRDLQNDTFVWRDDPEWARSGARGRRTAGSGEGGRPRTGPGRKRTLPAGAGRSSACERGQRLDERTHGAAARRGAAVEAVRPGLDAARREEAGDVGSGSVAAASKNGTESGSGRPAGSQPNAKAVRAPRARASASALVSRCDASPLRLALGEIASSRTCRVRSPPVTA